jgi:hypothetical protein
MTSLVSELDDILGSQDWKQLHRVNEKLTLAPINRRVWMDLDRYYEMPPHADLDRLSQLIVDIENGRRTVRALDENLKEIAIRDVFWRIKPWVIYRVPARGTIRCGDEPLYYEPQISDAEPRRRGRVPVPLRDQGELIAFLREIEKKAGHALKRDDAIEQLCKGRGVSRQQARAVLAIYRRAPS